MLCRKTLLAVFPLALTVAGCGGGSSTPTPPLSASARTAGGLTARLSEPSAHAAAGETVTYTLSLTNTTALPVAVATFGPTGGPTAATAGVPATLVIRDAAGTAVYPGPLTAIAPPPGYGPVTITLPPGGSLSQRFLVTTLTAPGAYRATATFDVAGHATDVGPLPITVPS